MNGRGSRRVWIGLLVGAVLVCLAYALAGRSTGDGGQAPFVVLWLGVLAFLWPAARRLADPLVGEAERVAVVVAAGVFTYLPKFLRNPRGPVFYDEIAHWTQTERIERTGDLFRPNPAVRVLPSYPGLHTLTAGLHDLTGLSTWQLAVVLLVVLHVVGALGVYLLARRITSSPVVASLAGLLWTVAPGAMFFNAQFAYQSLAIVFFVWVAVAVVEAQAATAGPRWAWTGLASVLCGAVVVTHHLTSYALVVLLVALTAAAVARRRHEVVGAWHPPAALLAVSLVVNAGWMAARGGRRAVRSIVDYLSPYPESGVRQLWNVVTGAGTRRTFFARSGLPPWEQAAAWLAPAAVIGLAVLGIVLLRRMAVRPTSAAYGLAATSLLYVGALPLVLTQSGAQGAHRSFPFSYLGVCLLAAAGLALVLGRTRTRSGRLGRLGPVAVALVVAVVTIGNTAANVNEYDRFPGRWEAGADSRSLTPELEEAAGWLHGYQTTGRVVADLYSGTAFGVLGTDREACAVAASCPGDLAIWRFYDGQPIRDQDLAQLRRGGYRFLVVDRRMATATPRSGFWFNREEEGAFEHRRPYSRKALNRLEGFTWLTKVYASTSFDLYEINLDATDVDVLRGQPGAKTKPKPKTTAPPSAGEQAAAATGGS